MSNNIVTVNVSQLVAPAPSTLQRTGAFISQGGTTLSSQHTALLTQASDLTPLLSAALSVTSISWSAGVATVTTAEPHGITTSDTFLTTIAGATTTAYNGTYLATATGLDTFTYPLASDGGTTPATGTITYTPRNVAELVAMATTFFAQGNATPVYVLELGAGEPAAGVTALTTYIGAPQIVNKKPLIFYGFLLPSSWADESTAVALANAHTSLTSKMYFWVTGTVSNYSAWLGIKSVIFEVQALDAPTTEFSLAAAFQNRLSLNPTNTNRLTPTNCQYLYGVTAYGVTLAQAATLKAAFVNWVDTGAEGGISNTIFRWGTTMDGHDFSYWYAVDWMQINYQLLLANAIIAGANNPQNPLVYNQQGINALQATAQGVTNNGIAFGVINNATPVSAIPFTTYTAANPSDYAAGIYNGLAEVAVPQTGFDSITFNLTVSDFGTA